MTRIHWLAVASLLVTLTITAPLRAEVTAEQVKAAIEKGVAYLKAKQTPKSGDWGEADLHPTGVTSLCSLALLNSGIPPNDPSILAALRYIQKHPRPNSIYSASLQVMVFATVDPVKYRVQIGELASWIESRQISKGEIGRAHV